MINDFFENNSYPIFVKTIDELAALMSSYADFIKQVLDLSLSVDSFSKVVIPFFELSEDDLRMLHPEEDTLPF